MNEYELFENDYIDEFKFLGMKNEDGVDSLKEFLKNKLMNEKLKREERFIWKLINDNYYYELYKQEKSIDLLYKSGFFLDGYNNLPEDDIDVLTTPLGKVLKNINDCSTSKPKVVLLTTGGFSPVHIGHISMMEKAKIRLEEKGYEVVGGYFSPSHDKYVDTKYNGLAKMNIEKRVTLLEDVIKDSEWLLVDKWEGYYREHSINFTDVIKRLERYLKKHLKNNEIKVCYVYGSDNINFSNVFKNKGLGICVSRENWTSVDKLLINKFKKYNVEFIEGLGENISSSLVREGRIDLLPENLKSVYNNDNKTNLVYEIRDDYSLALKKLNLENKLKDLKKDIIELISESIDNTLKVEVLSVNEQIKLYNENILNNKKTISLDTYINGTYNVDVSRVFEVSEGQRRTRNLIGRIGYITLEEQLSSIKKGTYWLVDDDKATGYTEMKIKELLSEDVKLKGFIGLNDLVRKEGVNSFDIVDLRDFLFGSYDGGLVVELPNGMKSRALYALPYVDVISRASVDPGKSIIFSLNIWKINYEMYKGRGIKIKDIHESVWELVKYCGFGLEDNVEDFIQYHINFLENFK